MTSRAKRWLGSAHVVGHHSKVSRRRIVPFALLLAMSGCSQDVCRCFDSDEAKRSCELGKENRCGTYRDDDSADNRAVVSCAVDLLRSGKEGRFSYAWSENAGQFSRSKTFVVLGDTVVHWSSGYEDLSAWTSDTVHRKAPSVEECGVGLGTEGRWACIETAIGSAEEIAVCDEGRQWEVYAAALTASR